MAGKAAAQQLARPDLAALKAEYEQNLESLEQTEQEIDSSVPEQLKARRRTKVRYLIDNLQMQGLSKRKAVERLAEDCSRLVFCRLSESTIWRDLGENKPLSNESGGIVPPNEFELANAKGIEIYSKMRALCDTAIDKMRNGPWDELMSADERAERDRMLPALIDLATENLDDRALVPESHFPIFMDCVVQIASVHAYSVYAQKAKDAAARLEAEAKLRGIATIEEITGKQYSKISKLRGRIVPRQFQPPDRETATLLKFTGESCPDCRSLRVDVGSEGGLQRICIDCRKIFTGVYPKIPKSAADLKADVFLKEVFPKWKKDNGLA